MGKVRVSHVGMGNILILSYIVILTTHNSHIVVLWWFHNCCRDNSDYRDILDIIIVIRLF